MQPIPHLRSPHDKLGGIVYLGRMLDKIRLHAQGQLPADYTANLGNIKGMFDERCLTFLGIDYDELVEKTLSTSNDEDVLAWILETGHHPEGEAVEVWNAFMSKRGWRDVAHERLQTRLKESGFTDDDGIHTFFDYIDADEGREMLPWQNRL